MDFRTLKDVRHFHDLTMKEMAEKIGISVSAYQLIEQKKRVGSTKTWMRIQELFNLSDEQVWKLQKPQN